MKIILSLLISIIGIVSAYADTIPNFKFPNNHIQIGLTSINFMDGYGYNTSRIYDKEIRFGDLCLSYSRHFNSKYFTTFTYSRYSRNNYMRIRNQSTYLNLNKGDIIRKSSNYFNLKIGILHTLISKKNLIGFIKPNIDLLYGYGTDHIFLAPYPGGFDFASVGVGTKGFGIGIGTEIGLIAYKHFSLSASLNYNYIFERGSYEELSPPNPEHYKYTPSRNILIFQPKIGFLF